MLPHQKIGLQHKPLPVLRIKDNVDLAGLSPQLEPLRDFTISKMVAKDHSLNNN